MMSRWSLKPSAELLEDLVVVGYGTQKKESLTGAISQIKGDQVYRDRGVTNTAVALQGEIALSYSDERIHTPR